jgi:Tol biopolymer transport system component
MEHGIEPSDTMRLEGLAPLETPKSAVKVLASGFGYVEFPQVSPDGKSVVFNVVSDFDTSQMLIMDRNGGNIRSLFTGEKVSTESVGTFLARHKGKIDEQGTWSRDGKTIYFRTNEKGTFGLASFDVRSGERRLLMSDPKKNLKHPVAIDESHIVGYGGPPGEKYPTTDKFSDLYIADLETGKIRFITHSDGSTAYKHPSEFKGKIIAHKEYKGGAEESSDLVVVDPKTGEEKNITATPDSSEKHPFYNEKRGILCFHSDESIGKNLWLYDPKSGRKCQLTFYGKAAQSPSWSPGGKKIYFVKKLENPPEGAPFFARQAEIRVIDVKDALKNLKDQAKERYRLMKDSGAPRDLMAQAKEEYRSYRFFLDKYE